MSLASDTAQVVSNLHGYCIPCPAGSLLIGDECERLRRPQFHRGSRSGRMMMMFCGPSCALCAAFFQAHRQQGGGLTFANESEAAAAWNAHLETAPEHADVLWKFIKSGLVPTTQNKP